VTGHPLTANYSSIKTAGMDVEKSCAIEKFPEKKI